MRIEPPNLRRAVAAGVSPAVEDGVPPPGWEIANPGIRCKQSDVITIFEACPSGVHPDTAPVGNQKRGRNAGFTRLKVAFDTALPDKSGVPGAASGCTPPSGRMPGSTA